MLEQVLKELSAEEMYKLARLTGLGTKLEAHRATVTWLQEVLSEITEKYLNPSTRYLEVIDIARKAPVGFISSLHRGIPSLLLRGIRAGMNDEALYRLADAEKIFADLGFKPYDFERVYLTSEQVPESGTLWPLTSSCPPSSSPRELHEWHTAHPEHPCPTEDEQRVLMRQTGLHMGMGIRSYWFLFSMV